MKTGTLKELNVQPGDVVEWIYDGEVGTIDNLMIWRGINGGKMNVSNSTFRDWRIISRAPHGDTPKLWKYMTAEEKGALLLAAHEGKVIEVWEGEWSKVINVIWYPWNAYRVKPDDVRETVVFDSKYYSFKLMEGYRITFETINGEPDLASIRMDKL